ncbi:hypothetical protein KCP73_04580 [Salmonella enterica subsp. enterica]|nr:hypothetical protein KCP73_04580 [Salmonella enterica subsp. enterica]
MWELNGCARCRLRQKAAVVYHRRIRYGCVLPKRTASSAMDILLPNSLASP